MRTTALALAFVLLARLSLSAAPLKGNFLLTADSTVTMTNKMTFSKGHASLVGKSGGAIHITADEITVDQSALYRTRVAVVTCRGVTSVSAGLTIPPSRELTLEIDRHANLYRLNSAGIVQSSSSSGAPINPAAAFSTTLPRLDLALRGTAVPH